ncbi:hypothetical protein VQH23_03805 [Pararoseomonas sp. SCSIO 73927]|uniref:hypothetical protein n=1 Tax=Pararoseomonas sp. SCSIO 73927 TaxID=3114537 RepID=UPI0030CBD10D
MRTRPLGRRAALATPLLAFIPGARAQSTGEGLRGGLLALHRAASHRGLTGSWDRPGVPIRADLLPPAGEAHVAAAEARMGRPMPPGLRHFFREVTAGLDVAWMLPGRRRVTAMGLARVEYAAVPPPPFGRPGPPPDPVINAGGLRIALDDAEALGGEWRQWRDARRESERGAADPAERAHHRYHAEVWERGYPIARTMGGDIVAVDTADTAERLMVLRHDGDDAPALLLGQDLRVHLAQQARLLFPGFETYRMELFADDGQGRDAVAAFAPGVDALVRDHGLFLPQPCVLDADGANALAWRAWMGV